MALFTDQLNGGQCDLGTAAAAAADIWEVSARGGDARLPVSHPANESRAAVRARWSAPCLLLVSFLRAGVFDAQNWLSAVS